MILQLKLAQTKCMLTLSKSLLSQNVKQKFQEKIADDVAVILGLESRNEILKNLIKFSLQ